MPQNLVGLLFRMGCPDRGSVLFIEVIVDYAVLKL